MITVILNIIGLACVIISLILIRKDFKSERDMYEEILLIHNNIMDYSTAIDNTLSNFDALMDSSLKKMEVIEKHNISKNPVADTHQFNQNSKIILEETIEDNIPTNKSYKKILDLKEIGLSNEEIAKNLDMGVREVEIILKIWNNR